jgi:hypothetical protein
LSDIGDRVSAPAGRVRQEGGGRKQKTVVDPTLAADLQALLTSVTRGDPMQPLLWCSRSLRNLAWITTDRNRPDISIRQRNYSIRRRGRSPHHGTLTGLSNRPEASTIGKCDRRWNFTWTSRLVTMI